MVSGKTILITNVTHFVGLVASAYLTDKGANIVVCDPSFGDADTLAEFQAENPDWNALGESSAADIVAAAGQIEVAKGVQWETEKWVKDKMPVKDWEDLCAQWRDNLERLADDFLRGEASVDPLSNSCTFCGLQPLCRVDEKQEILS